MGGQGSGNRKKTTPIKKGSTSKLVSNLTSLGFTNASKTIPSSQTTDATDTIDTTKLSEKTSSSGTTKMNFDMIPGLDEIRPPSTAPIQKPMIQNENTSAMVELATTYKIQILYRTKIMKKDVDVIEKMKCLMARLFQYDKSMQLFPYSVTNKSNPITTAKDIPNDIESFQIYIPDASINPRSKTLRMSFKISSEMRLWQIKMIQGVKQYLSQYSVYLDETYLVTLDNVKVGGLILSHPQFTRRDIATNDLNTRINESEEIKTPIQLSPFNMWNSIGNKISTRMLAVECSKEHIQLVKHRLFSKLLNVPEAMKYSNTRYFKFMPFNATGPITNKVIRSGIYLQNKYLLQTTSITIVNISKLDWVVPHETDTFQAIALNATIPDTTSKIFTSMEMGMMDNKVHLVTTKPALEAATAWVDTFLTVMHDLKETREFWKERTGFGSSPERIDRPICSDAQMAYANYLDQSIVPLVGTSYEDSGAKEAPSTSRRSYSRVVYGDTKLITPTQETEVSTLTPSTQANDNILLQKTVNQAVYNMQEESKKGQQHMRLTLLEEMKQISEEHSARTVKMEESVEVFDHMVKELHASNRAKSNEMVAYKKRLEQIGTTTAETAVKVDKLAVSMNDKVDKLNLTMKAFINVMADAICNGGNDLNTSTKQKKNLIELSQLLEVDNDTMEIDDSSDETKTSKPSPGASDALGSEGFQK